MAESTGQHCRGVVLVTTSRLVAVPTSSDDVLEHMPVSRNGNPRYRVRFGNGETFTTATDSMIAYALPNWFRGPDRPGALLLTLNKRGNIVGCCGLPSVSAWQEWERRTARGSGVTS